MFKRLCVFCGSSGGDDPEFVRLTRETGSLLAARGIGVVFGGGHVGLMGALADGALESQGEVIGVIPESLREKELAHRGVKDMRVVKTMHERKQLMHDLSGGFLALPGGIGTMDELFEAWTWLQLGYHQKPIGLLNVNGYYDALLAFLDTAAARQFVNTRHRDLLLVGTSPAELVDRMAAWRSPALPRYLERGDV
jgi:uncharacterized protein (TIGR00730 family)